MPRFPEESEAGEEAAVTSDMDIESPGEEETPASPKPCGTQTDPQATASQPQAQEAKPSARRGANPPGRQGFPKRRPRWNLQGAPRPMLFPVQPLRLLPSFSRPGVAQRALFVPLPLFPRSPVLQCPLAPQQMPVFQLSPYQTAPGFPAAQLALAAQLTPAPQLAPMPQMGPVLQLAPGLEQLPVSQLGPVPEPPVYAQPRVYRLSPALQQSPVTVHVPLCQQQALLQLPEVFQPPAVYQQAPGYQPAPFPMRAPADQLPWRAALQTPGALSQGQPLGSLYQHQAGPQYQLLTQDPSPRPGSQSPLLRQSRASSAPPGDSKAATSMYGSRGP